MKDLRKFEILNWRHFYRKPLNMIPPCLHSVANKMEGVFIDLTRFPDCENHRVLVREFGSEEKLEKLREEHGWILEEIRENQNVPE